MLNHSILLIAFIHIVFIGRNEANLICRNPSTIELGLKLFSHELNKKVVFMNRMGYDFDYSDVLGYKAGNNNNLVKRQFENNESICSMDRSQMKFNDTYPFVYVSIECDESQIFEISPTLKYKCVAIKEDKTFLQKGQCMSNGVYEWTPFNRNVTILCAAKFI